MEGHANNGGWTGEPGAGGMPGDDVVAQVASYWDIDSATYNRARGHVAGSPAEKAAWTAALTRYLPPPPSAVLDVGCGTGFLALPVAQLGHRVTGLDVSPKMLEELERQANALGLKLATVVGDASVPPGEKFDAVVERHLLWTLPDPVGALAAWRKAAPNGRLILFEGLWGQSDPAESRRNKARQAVRRMRRIPPDHHASYAPELKEKLPFGQGTHPDRVAAAVERAGWRQVTLERLRDVEWARQLQRQPAERLLGVTPVFVVSAR